MDLELLYTLQQVRVATPALTTLMNLCSYLAHEILIVAILCTIYWCLNKDFAYRLCFSYFVSGLFVQGLKVAFRIPRPWVRDARLFPDEVAAPAATGFSFPSGHTQTATSLYGAFAFYVKKWWSYVIGFVIIGLVMFSRMYLGCHTPQDVLVSFAISLILVIVVSLFYDKVHVTARMRILIAVLIELASAVVMIFTCLSISTGRILPEDYSNAYDAIKIAGAGFGVGLAYYLEKTKLNFNPHLPGKYWWVQVLKVVIGAGIALAFKELPKLLIQDATPVALIVALHMIRYALTIFWVVYLYPLLFTKALRKLQ